MAFVAALAVGGALAKEGDDMKPPTGDEAVPTKLAAEALLLGVARADKRIVAVGEYGDILLSDDDGTTWHQAKKVPTNVTLTAVYFADAKTGWAVGHDTVILQTQDAGETWVKQYGGGESDNALLSVYFADASHGWAVGAFNFTAETKDGGKTWVERKTLMPPGTAPLSAGPDPTAALVGTKDPAEIAAAKAATPGPESPPPSTAQGADPYAAATGDENHLNAMFAGPDAATLFVAAEAGAIYRSLDGGVTWQKVLTGYAGSFWGGLTAKDGSIYAAGMRGNLWRSTDKGQHWTKLDTAGADQSIASGIQLADGSLVFVGLGGQVLYSTPDGAKFTLTYRPDRKGLNAVIQDGAAKLLVFGEAGVQTQSPTPLKEEIDVPLPPAEGG
jgi:photosystem II stability/assembly factor-like uncharacterized protein